MEFNTLIKTQFFQILQKYGFEIVEEFNNIIRFQSHLMKLNLAFNEYEKGYLVELGRRDGILYPLNDNIVKNLFDYNLSIEKVTLENFVKNLCVIFETGKGSEILKGNIEEFVNFKLKEINDFNIDLFENQILETAIKAWESKNYKAFVKNIDLIENDRIPISYQLKYKIAKQKLIE